MQHVLVHVSLESGEPLGPQPAVSFRPKLNDMEAGLVDAVETPLGVRAGAYETGFSEDLEVLGDGRLSWLELRDEVSDGTFSGDTGRRRRRLRGPHQIVVRS